MDREMLKKIGKKLVNYGFGLFAMLLPAVMQFVLFAFYARVLGVEQYGIYIAMLSWSPICFELVGWGSGEYLVKRTTQDHKSYGAARAHMTKALLVTVLPATAIFTLAGWFVVGHSIAITTFIVLGLCEFVGLRLLVNAEQNAIALGRFSYANWFRALQALPRLLGVFGAYFVLGLSTIEPLAIAGSAGILVAGLLAELVIRRNFPPMDALRFLPQGVRDGTWFMGNQLVRAGQQNVDRVILSTLVDPTTLALYGTAQRFVQVGMIPLQAVLRLTYPKFFAEGKAGVSPAFRYGLKILPIVASIAAVTSIGLVMAAQLVPLLVGSQYDGSVDYLSYMAPILVLFAINYIAADTLSGSGNLFIRTLLTASGVGLQALVFALLHDGFEIVLASYVGIGASCILTLSAIAWLMRAERRSMSAVSA